MAIDLIAGIKPKNSGAFWMVEDVDFLGGYQVQPTLTARDAIPLLNQKVGMLCYVIETATTYRLTATGSPGTWAVSAGGFVAGGDLSGSATSQTVAKINGVALSGTPATGYVLTATGVGTATWSPAATGFTAGGDLSGTSTSQVVAKVNGVSIGVAPTAAGQILTSTGTAAATWQAAPSGFTAGGDLTGTSTSQTVAKVNGVAVSGTPSTGYILTATGATTATWQTAPASFTAGGDLTGSATNQTVAKLGGITLSGTPTGSGWTLRTTGSTAAAWTAPPTGTGFPHYTSGALDSATKLVDLTADITGLLPPVNGGAATRTNYPTFTTTDASVVTVATSRAIPSPGCADVIASIVARDQTGAMYRVDLTMSIERDASGTYTTALSEAVNAEYTHLLGVAAHLTLSSNTVVLTCTGKAGTTVTWIEPYFLAVVG
jgi:hypothetical protein